MRPNDIDKLRRCAQEYTNNPGPKRRMIPVSKKKQEPITFKTVLQCAIVVAIIVGGGYVAGVFGNLAAPGNGKELEAEAQLKEATNLSEYSDKINSIYENAKSTIEEALDKAKSDDDKTSDKDILKSIDNEFKNFKELHGNKDYKTFSETSKDVEEISLLNEEIEACQLSIRSYMALQRSYSIGSKEYKDIQTEIDAKYSTIKKDKENLEKIKNGIIVEKLYANNDNDSKSK